ncbi:MAG: PilZ domain-containing protein [Candidatus Electrothrix sp. YB6]
MESMTEYIPEKRHYTRIIFNKDNKVQAGITVPDAPETKQNFSSSVLNLSEGGLQLSIKREELPEVQTGNTFILTSITGVPELEALTDISMRIAWLMDNEYLEHVLLGMCFTSLSEEQRQTLRSFVTYHLERTAEQEAG